MDPHPIYLDFNASTPVDPEVVEAMLPFLKGHFGNPSSSHVLGRAAKESVERARAHVSDLIGADPSEIVFTSGGSESNNMVIQGVARCSKAVGRRVVTSAVEHPAVLEPCRALEEEGCQLTVLPVDSIGRVSPDDAARSITPEVILISVMHANNEVGTIQPISEIAALARSRNVLFHTDAAQSVGKIPVRVDDLGVDFLSIAGHKLHAPKGIGALYIRSGRELPSLIRGAGQEGGRRAGTLNVLEIVGLGKACELAKGRMETTVEHCRRMRDRLWEGLSGELDSLRLNGDLGASLPNTLSVGFPGVDAGNLLERIGDRVAASAGAACHAGGVQISAVLKAMKVPVEYAMGTVRLSVGHTTTPEEIDKSIEIIRSGVRP